MDATDTPLLMAIDQGTTSTRVCVFDRSGGLVSMAQRKHQQITPADGFVEHDPFEIYAMIQLLLTDVARDFLRLGLHISSIKACGISCQRETFVVWDRETGLPLHNAIVWLDTRSADIVSGLQGEHEARIRSKTGLPLSTYFSGTKLRWLYENDPVIQRAFDERSCYVGTMDSWIIYNITAQEQCPRFPPTDEGDVPEWMQHYRHVTDVTNAARTLLFDVRTNAWDPELCALFKVPMECLPTVLPCSGTLFGEIKSGLFRGIPIAGVAGDQSASLFGHMCYQPGSCKCTFGTGAFLLQNIGPEFALNDGGALTTIGYQIGGARPVYCLEGSVAIAGAALEWLARIGVLPSLAQVDEMIGEVIGDKSTVTFVPAFNGLFCPHWRADARGTILGISTYTNAGHIVRAAVEAIALQVFDLLECFATGGSYASGLCVDGGVVNSRLFTQILSNLCDVTVARTAMLESSALGAALLAGLTVGIYRGEADILQTIRNPTTDVAPSMAPAERREVLQRWKVALAKSFTAPDA